MTAEAEKSPENAKAQSARLMAVQAVYEILQNSKPGQAVIEDFLSTRVGMEVEGEKLGPPDGALFKAIVLGVEERKMELEEMLKAQYNQGHKGLEKGIEPLLKAILLCGTYELLAHQDIDSPIIINDYLNVTHGFYGQGEVSLVNGILDAVFKILSA